MSILQHACTGMNTHTHTHRYTPVHTYTTHMYTYVHVDTHAHTSRHIHLFAIRIHTCTHTCTQTSHIESTQVHIHIHHLLPITHVGAGTLQLPVSRHAVELHSTDTHTLVTFKADRISRGWDGIHGEVIHKMKRGSPIARQLQRTG